MVKIEIDGKEVSAEPGSMIIEAADDAGIYIPRFCYHNKLSIAANCRMCLVEVDKSKKALPACATPINEGMKVFTHSPKAIEAQKAVMEFLLINHPLDCPICDQGGECELQDLSMGYGRDNSLFTENKRSVADENIGPLIETHMTRCIHCTRCVRFGQEIAGVRELGMTGRGENAEITTYIKHTLKSELSANIVDLCPVGALTDKPFAFKARSFEMQQTPAISPHDCVGTNIYLQQLRNRVLRVVPRENEAINEIWIADRDRFSHLGLTKARSEQVMIRERDELKATDWETAFQFLTQQLQTIIQEHGADEVAALIHPMSTVEELYLLQKWMRAIGSNNVDHRLRETDVSDQESFATAPHLPIKIEAIETQQKIILMGSNIQKAQPMLAHRIRKATQNGGKIYAFNPVDFEFYFDTAANFIVDPNYWLETLAEVAKLLSKQSAPTLSKDLQLALAKVEPSEQAKQFAEVLMTEGETLILVGALFMHHPHAAQLRTLTRWIAELCGAKIGFLTDSANGYGAWLAGAVPHRKAGFSSAKQIGAKKIGTSALESLKRKKKAYILFNLEPELDVANSAKMREALAAADLVIAITPFMSDQLREFADVVLPIVPFTETPGSYINIEGTWQTFKTACKPTGEARPGWKVLRVLGNYFELEGFEFSTCEEVRDELKAILSQAKPGEDQLPELKLQFSPAPKLTRISYWPIYRVDGWVRRSQPLQESFTNQGLMITMHPKLAAKLQVHAGDSVTVKDASGSATLPVMISARVPETTVLIPHGYVETAGLGDAFAAIEIVKITLPSSRGEDRGIHK